MDWNNVEKRLADFNKARRPEKIELNLNNNKCNGCKKENNNEMQ